MSSTVRAPVEEAICVDQEEHRPPAGQRSSVLESEAIVHQDPPAHPVPSMQDAFEESIVEAIEGIGVWRPQLDHGAEARRQRLLDSPHFDDSMAARWQQRPQARHHPLQKSVSQIIFGLHLLLTGQAKSDEAVVAILQGHVNDFDAFLQQTSNDFALAVRDLDERVRFLRLPMQHMDVFESMLEERKFRAQLLEGNGRIRHIVDRTAAAMHAALADVDRALEATATLGKYLAETGSGAAHSANDSFAEVADAMRGNELGWRRALTGLQASANTLCGGTLQLDTLMKDMARLAGAASRRSKSRAPANTAPSSPGLRSKFSITDSSHSSVAAMPREPALVSAKAVEAAQNPPPLNKSQVSTAGSWASFQVPRPKTSDSRTMSRPRKHEARAADARGDTSELARFLKETNKAKSSHENPLRSNPPNSALAAVTALPRTTSQGSIDIFAAARSGSSGKSSPSLLRSKSSGVLEANGPARTRQHQHSPSLQSRPLAAVAALSRSQSTTLGKGGPGLDQLPETGFTRRVSKRIKQMSPNAPFGNTSSTHVRQTLPTSTRVDGNSNVTGATTPTQGQSSRQAAPKPRLTSAQSYVVHDTGDDAGVRRLGPHGSAVPRGAPSSPSLLGPYPSDRSIMSTSAASSRYFSLKKIFHRRDGSGRVVS